MTRPLLEIADLIRSAGAAFIERNHQWIRWRHVKVLLAMARCRTAALGGHLDECTRCAHRPPISYNSCRNRHCQSARPLLANGGLLLVAANFCPPVTCTWSSPCRAT